MKTVLKGLFCLALLVGTVAANATAVTYDFTGTVTAASGIYASAGTTVTGTYTFDVSAANPSQSSGTVGDTSNPWISGAYGGAVFSSTTPGSLVFATTLDSGGVSYSVTSPGSSGSDSFLAGLPNTDDYAAEDIEYAAARTYVFSRIDLVGNSAATAPFDADGLPVLSKAITNTGTLYSEVSGAPNGELVYTITSLTPVPLPASVWLLLSALGGMGLLAQRAATVPLAWTARA